MTFHYINYNWVLNKKVIGFQYCPLPRTELQIFISFLEKHIHSVTLDNASGNKVV